MNHNEPLPRHASAQGASHPCRADVDREKDRAFAAVRSLHRDPSLARPIRANLFQSGDDKSAWVLNWNRPLKRRERD